MQGEQLTRVPKGYPPDHPAADLLRYKQFLFYVLLDPAIAATPKLEQEMVKRFRALTPFLEFLNAPLAKASAPLTTVRGFENSVWGRTAPLGTAQE